MSRQLVSQKEILPPKDFVIKDNQSLLMDESYPQIEEGVEYNDFEIIFKLFGGAMGNTFLVRYKPSGVLYVMKRVDYLDENDKRIADEEIAQMKRLTSRYTRVLELFAQIILALDFIHSQGVVHRDIKPENIFIMEDGQVKLGDFGLSKILNEKNYATVAGTKQYFALEVYIEGKMYFSTDVYAVGICIIECLTGKHPFIGQNDQQTMENILNGRSTKLPSWIPFDLKKLISQMIDSSFNSRPTVQEIMKNEQLQSIILQIKEKERTIVAMKEKQQQYIVLSSIENVSLEQLKAIKQELISLNDFQKANCENMLQCKNALSVVRSIYQLDTNNSNDETLKITTEIFQLVIKTIKRFNIKLKEGIDLVIQSGLVVEFIDLVRRYQINKLIVEFINEILQICDFSTIQQSHKIYQMNLIQILTPKLKDIQYKYQSFIISTFTSIIRNGWKQIQSSNNLQYISYQQQNSYQSTNQQSLQTQLQQLLILPHPYLHKLEKHGTIRKLIDIVLIDENEDFLNKSQVCRILDTLFIEGARIPTDMQQYVIDQLYGQINESGQNISQQQIKKIHSLISLSFLAINKENHEVIVDGEIIQTSLTLIKNQLNGTFIENEIISNCLQILQLCYIYGNPITRKLIRLEITDESLKRLKNNKGLGEISEIFESTFADPQTMDKLMRMKRPIGLRNEEYKIELIRLGIIEELNKEINKIMKNDKFQRQKDGQIRIISQILNLLIDKNKDGSIFIVEQTIFVENLIEILNSLPIEHIKYNLISPLLQISLTVPFEQKKKLFQKGIIQSMVRLLDSSDKQIRLDSSRIILVVVNSGIDGLQEGELNPFHKQLAEDRTIDKLIQIFNDKNNLDIQANISQIIGHLYKALLLPSGIGKEIIEKLKEGFSPQFLVLTLLAECQGNHEVILLNEYEKKLFEFEWIVNGYLRFIIPLLKYGQDLNKIKISLTVKEKVAKLTNETYLSVLGQKIELKQEQKDEIKAKSEEILVMIKNIIGDDNIELIHKYMKQFYSNEYHNKQSSIQIILYIVKSAVGNVKEGQQHPYNQQLMEDGTLAKIIQLFQDNQQENIHHIIALILAYLYKNSDLPNEFAEKIIKSLIYESNFNELELLMECDENQILIFNIISRELYQSIYGIENREITALNLYEKQHNFLNYIFYNRENEKLRINAINGGIVDALLNIFSDLDLDLILYSHFMSFFNFTYPYNSTISKLLVERKPFPSLIRLFDHKNQEIVQESINAMVNIIYSGAVGSDENLVHPFYNDFASAGGIEKVFLLFKRNLNEQICACASKCLGIILRQQKNEDVILKQDITQYLQSLNNHSNKLLDCEVQLALKCLSQSTSLLSLNNTQS